MSSYKYARYLTRLASQPWAITPSKLADILALMELRASGHKLSDEEIVARFGEGPNRSAPRHDGMVAVIPVGGTIAYRADSFEAGSGGTSAQWLKRTIAKAAKDPAIKSILLDVASPGGSVEGLPELADAIYEARKAKPIVAHANAMAASAAYWLASQADEFVMTPSGHVGAIGVYMLHVDESKALEQQGVRIEAISAGENKLEGAPWGPLTADTRAHLQANVDRVYDAFIGAVARGRRTSQATVRESYGGGRIFDAKDAKKRGMVDTVEAFEDTLDRMVNRKAMVGASGSRADAPQWIAAAQYGGEVGGPDEAAPVAETFGGIDVTDHADTTATISIATTTGTTGTVVTPVVVNAPEPAVDPLIADADAVERDRERMDLAIRLRERM